MYGNQDQSGNDLDFRELIVLLYERKKIIFGVVALFLAVGIAYCLIAKNVYEVKTAIEIGRYAGSICEPPASLEKKLNLTEKDVEKDNAEIVDIAIVLNTDIVEITAHSETKDAGLKRIGQVTNNIMANHQEKIDNFKKDIEIKLSNLKNKRDAIIKINDSDIMSIIEINAQIKDFELMIRPYNIRMSQIISTSVSEKPIKPNRKLVIALSFIGGIIVSVLGIFAYEFGKNIAEYRKRMIEQGRL